MNRSTGELKYEYIAKQADGPTIEFSRLFVNEEGVGNLVSIYKEGGDAHMVSVVAPERSESTEISISFEKDGASDDIAQASYCVTVSDFTASATGACDDADLPSGDLGEIVAEIDGYAGASALRAAYFGTDELLSVDNATFSFETSADAEFHTTVVAE